MKKNNPVTNAAVSLGGNPRQRQMLRLLWSHNRLSRWELHEILHVNPNAVGVDVAHLIENALIRECATDPKRPGRPRVPLEIDPSNRHVIGLAINPRMVQATRLNLQGHPLGDLLTKEVTSPEKLVTESQHLAAQLVNKQTLAIGLSATGIIDPLKRSFSSALPGRRPVTLTPIYDVAANVPIILENNMHALAARWLLTHQAETKDDVLMVCIRDGQFGAAMLIDGRPNRGCAIGANEIGHNRFFVETDKCYCGHMGCLERICSTPFLHRINPGPQTLMERAAHFDGSDKALNTLIDYLAMGLANAINFVRPNRFVLVSELTRYQVFNDSLLQLIRSRLLVEIGQRVCVDLWDQPAAHSGQTAGWLALAALYREGWTPA